MGYFSLLDYFLHIESTRQIIQKNINIQANITLDITKKIPDSQLGTATYRIYEKWKKEA